MVEDNGIADMDPGSKVNPIVLIIRDKEEWPTDEFLTLLNEEGYNAIDGDENSLPSALAVGEPFAIIGSLLIWLCTDPQCSRMLSRHLWLHYYKA